MKDALSSVLFGGVELLTQPGTVMTPRPASEALVEQAVTVIGERQVHVADVGTGSGAIACLVALRCPRAQVTATELSAEAAVIAEVNAALLGVADRVHVIRTSLLDGVSGPFDLVLANLPYLPKQQPDSRYASEPAAAIYGEGVDGLDLYRRLVGDCREKLAPEGTLVIQVDAWPVSASYQELAERDWQLVELAVR